MRNLVVLSLSVNFLKTFAYYTDPAELSLDATTYAAFESKIKEFRLEGNQWVLSHYIISLFI